MKKTMIALTCVFVLAFAVFLTLCNVLEGGPWLALAITFGTISYHFLMRFAVGGVVNSILHNRVDHRRRWFEPRPFEAGLYKRLKVKKWKNNMPTYSPQTFSLETHTLEEVVQATCQSEIVHEIIVLLSFVPLLTVPVFGEFWVFLLTSVAAALIDLSFVIMQRYNRPRLIRLLKSQRGQK